MKNNIKMENTNALKNLRVDLKTVIIISLVLLVIFFGFSYWKFVILFLTHISY